MQLQHVVGEEAVVAVALQVADKHVVVCILSHCRTFIVS
jgi:hypothetical protein